MAHRDPPLPSQPPGATSPGSGLAVSALVLCSLGLLTDAPVARSSALLPTRNHGRTSRVKGRELSTELDHPVSTRPVEQPNLAAGQEGHGWMTAPVHLVAAAYGRAQLRYEEVMNLAELCEEVPAAGIRNESIDFTESESLAGLNSGNHWGDDNVHSRRIPSPCKGITIAPPRLQGRLSAARRPGSRRGTRRLRAGPWLPLAPSGKTAAAATAFPRALRVSSWKAARNGRWRLSRPPRLRSGGRSTPPRAASPSGCAGAPVNMAAAGGRWRWLLWAAGNRRAAASRSGLGAVVWRAEGRKAVGFGGGRRGEGSSGRRCGGREVRGSGEGWGLVAHVVASSAGFVEDLDESFKENRKDDIWLVDFYAPWCGHCKKLEPVWNEVGIEMKNMGSPVKVGKMDATSFSSIASEFGVRGYPTIKLLKGDLAYNYRGPRTKDDIIEFANRVAGPLIRPLPSQHMFEHVQKRHHVLFVYVGGESPLKEKYIEVASELIVYTYFFSASEDVLPEYVTLPELPAVVVFKDGTYFVYDEYEDGDLSSWINRERFQGYLNVDGFTLYELGDTGKLVAIAVIDDKNSSVEHTRLKSIIQEVARDYRDHFHRDFQFGHMDGNDYINSLLMDDLTIPTIVVLNTSNQQYFLPDRHIENTEDMVQFINNILDGTAEAQGGDGLLQRIKRIIYDAKSTVVSVFKSSPLLGCFLFGLPLGVISIMCYGICTADTDGGIDEHEGAKKENGDRDLTDEGSEEEQEEEKNRKYTELSDGEFKQKDIMEKKKD
ncbi:protein disulfide-isomerase TMX3 [Sarcoramphus papa]